MILLMGPMADPVLANVCARLAARNADLMLVHQESEGDSWDIAWSTERGGMADRLRIGTRTIHLSDIDSVYLRAMGSRAASTPREQLHVELGQAEEGVYLYCATTLDQRQLVIVEPARTVMLESYYEEIARAL